MYCYFVTESFFQYTLVNDFADLLTLSIAESLGCILSCFLYIKWEGGKKLLFCVLPMISVFSLVMLAVHDEASSQAASFLVAIPILLLRFLLSMILNTLMMVTFNGYPIVLLGAVFGVMQLAGRVAGVIGIMSADGAMTGSKILMAVLSFGAAAINAKWYDDRKRVM